MTDPRYPGPPPPRAPETFGMPDHLGELIAIKGVRFEADFPGTGQYGARDCVFSDIEVIAGTQTGMLFRDSWVMNQIIVDQLKDNLGKVMYARVAQQGRAYKLDPINPGDAALIDAWLANRKAKAEQANANRDAANADHAATAAGQAYLDQEAGRAPATTQAPAQPAAAGYDDPPF